MNANRLPLLIVIAAGVALRLTDITIPDLATDEAQAAFGVSPAWTPLGMGFLRASQWLFGTNIIAIRSVSIALGLLTLPIIFGITKRLSNEPTALLATTIAAIFPSHILFSRLAYLSVQLSFWWLLTLFAFLKARREPRTPWFVLLFFASVAATMTKTQGLLLPLFFIIGTFIEDRRRRKPLTSPSPILVTLLISLIPVAFYILSHPGIAATLLLYGGNMYGLSDIGARIATLVATWWSLLSLFLIAMVGSGCSLRKLPWPVLALLGIVTFTGLVLGPGHGYYATHLVLFAIPIGMGLTRLQPLLRSAVLGLLLLTTLAMLGPWRTPWSNPLFVERGFWNTHAKEINAALRDEEAVTVLGDAGHHIRWYLNPRVIIGRNMEPPYPTDFVVLLGIAEAVKASGTVKYATEEVAVVRITEAKPR